MDFDPRFKDAILYLRGVVEGKIRPEKLEAGKERISELLDQSVLVAEEAITYTINENGKEIDLSVIDIDELREKMKHTKNKNLEIADLRQHIEKKLQQMLKRNVTRSNFAERFKAIIDAYNAGGSQTDDFYEKILKFMEELRAEEERHIKEELTEEELELFDLLRKEKLSKAEEQKVKLAAKELCNTLLSKKNELFVVGWQNDPQPKEKVKAEIIESLNRHLPDSYDREIFTIKSNVVFEHIVDQVLMGYNWVA
jgi:type I restriction enzyme R subunit